MNEEPIIRNAREFCVKTHAGQKRDNGSDYSNHPIAVAAMLQSRGHADPVLLVAALLHDVIEDTATTREDLEAAFGVEVAGLVMELTNPLPQDRPFAEKHAALLEHARIMSPRARLVKLADRLHNLRDMGTWPIWKQERYAQAALELLEVLKPWPDEELANLVQDEAATAMTRYHPFRAPSLELRFAIESFLLEDIVLSLQLWLRCMCGGSRDEAQFRQVILGSDLLVVANPYWGVSGRDWTALPEPLGYEGMANWIYDWRKVAHYPECLQVDGHVEEGFLLFCVPWDCEPSRFRGHLAVVPKFFRLHK